jgi:predicted PhzF superfamily epimerase YddE/YHI9
MKQSVIQVDAFTAVPFQGNPAAVCLLERERDAAWMQLVAREMNLAETAFLSPEGDGYRLRWFTPTVEVDLCGHATLATAHVLLELGKAHASGIIRFQTRSGELTARRDGEFIEMDFPAEPAIAVAPPDGLVDALRAKPLFVGRNRMDYLVEVGSADDVRAIQPDFGALRQLSVRGVIVTARSDDGVHDFVSRFFAPGAGVDEDPVTGSAHCCLAPYWAEKLGRTDMAGYQASARGGTVHVRYRPPRVLLRGQAVTVLRGELEDGRA